VELAASSAADIAATLDRVPKVNAIFSSPLARCRKLAVALSSRDRIPLNLLDELRELSFGAWEGKRWSAIDRSMSDFWSQDPWHRAPPGGENESALWERVQRAHRELTSSDADRIAVVAHGGPLRLLRCLLSRRPIEERWSWSIEPGGVHIIITAR